VTNSKKKRRSDYRAPTRPVAPSRPAEPAQQRSAGLLGGLLGRGSVAPPAQSPYPTLRQSFGRGFLAVCSSPVVLGITLVVPFLVWAVLQLLGSVPLIGNLAGYLSLPSIGVSSDIVAANQTFGVRGGSLAAPVLIAIRAVLTAVLTGLVVEQIRYGRVTGRGLRGGLRAIPVTLAIGILAFSATLIINIVGGFGLGIAVSLLLLVGSVFFLAYGPIVGVEHPRGIGLALRRTFAAARVPGSQNLILAFGYALFAFISPLLVPGLGRVDANPGVATWVGVLAVNVVHVGFLGVYAYRYLYAEPELAEPDVDRRRARA